MKTISMIDIETTGLSPDTDEVIEIGAVIFEAEAPFKVINTFNVKVKPEHIETAHPRALEVNGYNEKDWKDAVDIDEALKQLHAIEGIKDSRFAAYNVSFDWGFFQFLYGARKMREPFNHLRLDMFTLAWSRIPQDKLSHWRLKNVCEYLKVPPEPEVHRALNGAQASYECYCKLMGEGFVVSEQVPLL